MPLVTISHEKSVTLNIDVTVDWFTSAGREFGKAVFIIPFESAAWDEEVINEKGGFIVHISTQYGIWSGVATQVEDHDAGFEVTAWDFRVYVGTRSVAPNRSFHGVTAGIIAKRAFEDALVGLGGLPFTVGSILEAPPIIAQYQFTGQKLQDVLTELAERTGHHWTIDHQGIFHWVSISGVSHDYILIDDGLFRDKLQRRPLREEFSESIEVEDTGRTFTVYNPSVPLTWPSQEIREL